MTIPDDWTQTFVNTVNYNQKTHASFSGNNLSNHSTYCLNLYGDRSGDKFSNKGKIFFVKDYLEYDNAISTRMIYRNNTNNAIPKPYVIQRYSSNTAFYAWGTYSTTQFRLNGGNGNAYLDYMESANLRATISGGRTWNDWNALRMDTWKQGPDLRIKCYFVEGYQDVDDIPSDVNEWTLALDVTHEYGNNIFIVNSVLGSVTTNTAINGNAPFNIDYPGGKCGFGAAYYAYAAGDDYETFADSIEQKKS